MTLKLGQIGLFGKAECPKHTASKVVLLHGFGVFKGGDTQSLDVADGGAVAGAYPASADLHRADRGNQVAAPLLFRSGPTALGVFAAAEALLAAASVSLFRSEIPMRAVPQALDEKRA